MTDDTAAPRFTEQEMLREAAGQDAFAAGLEKCGLGGSVPRRVAAMLRQAADDLSNAPTRDDLSALIADHFMLGKKYADQYADIFIAAGVKVRP